LLSAMTLPSSARPAPLLRACGGRSIASISNHVFPIKTRNFSSAPAPPTEQKDTPDPAPEGDAPEDPTLLRLREEVESLTERVSEIDDKYKRALAEAENVRRRMERQVSDAKLFGNQKFCKDLLDVSDILSRATDSVPPEAVSAENPHLKSLHEGLLMTQAQLNQVFKRYGLEPVNPLGERFDPNLHEALFEQNVEGKEPGTIAVVTKIGYTLHDRILRPALVGVVKKA